MIDAGSSRQPALRDWLLGVCGLFALISGLERLLTALTWSAMLYQNGVELAGAVRPCWRVLI